MKTTNYTKQIAIAAVAALCATAAMGAHADEALLNVQTRTVHFADLNLNTPAGAAVLYKRIRNAAEQVCGDVDSRRLDEAAVAKACVERAVNTSVQAVKTINVASLR